MMISSCDPCGRICTILSEEQTKFLWPFESIFIPQSFREHIVLVLGWTTGRRGYVSIVMITRNIPDEAIRDHYIEIRAPRRRATADESTVILRKNKIFSALVEYSYVRLDWVWEVPFAILMAVPKSGMQLMVRAVSMEKVMSFYSKWGWDQAWGQTYPSLLEYLPQAEYCHDQDALGTPRRIGREGEADHSQTTIQPFQVLNGLASSGTVEHNGDAGYGAQVGSDSTGSWDSEMVYAGDAHCAALAKMLQQAR